MDILTEIFWRMKQFYETYKDYSKLSALLREISCTNNLIILECVDRRKENFTSGFVYRNDIQSVNWKDRSTVVFLNGL